MNEDKLLLEEIRDEIRHGNDELRLFKKFLEARFPILNNEMVVSIPNQKGDSTMGAPVTLTVGNGSVQATEQEFLNGVAAPNQGTISWASDTPSVATVDPVSGMVTPVAAGVANISAADSVNQLTDSVAVTVLAGGPPPPVNNTSMVVTVPPQTAPASRRF
jgi:hypothetical protein